MTPAELHPALRQSLFVAGTDTGVGKTWVATRLIAALAAAGHRVAAMKPVAAGAEMTSHGLRNDDALELMGAANVRLPYELVNPVCLARATAPHLAAEETGTRIDPDMIAAAFAQIRQRSELVIVEGAGGWLAPIGPAAADGETGPTMEDVARRLGLPVLLVVGIRLGAISHALLTAAAIRRAGLPLAGWVANPVDPGFADTALYVDSLRRRMPCALLWTAPQVILPGQ
ncbi:MAG: dethiobiotin synthase [Pseudomonadota bacterium]|jgi:dethiobiotin synthetase|nr:MAG: dethiobiotin synthase [Pseudomonadota bacterium]